MKFTVADPFTNTRTWKVGISCIDDAKRNRWRSVAPTLQELLKKRGLPMVLKMAIANALDALR